ncbi:hypothetical protein [Pseudonocardia acidicola]|uniref:Uncharacterized protein n=1 Tax=Pseudonocardia acidicola TaxID=2724939 RepID=A0ABX1SEK6_9PSEU|nr:hypothetical protein [Pseudonocardia acidicola]NMH98674.1 hypothetical protein [Pseudonocardia acidicola]
MTPGRNDAARPTTTGTSRCDCSPYRRATAHFHRTEHPVIRSDEPGESWRWCYVDERIV